MRLESHGQLRRVGQPPHDIVAWIGEPEPIKDDSGVWVCACGIAGLNGLGHERRGHAATAMQAVLLAYRGLRALLEREIRLGAILTFHGETEPVDVAEFFGDTE